MRFWIGVASREHVKRGEAEGFCQLCHGKAQPLKRMSVGEWIIYYPPKELFGQNEPCQKFTSIGEVVGSEVYQHAMAPGFTPYRRDVRFLPCKEVKIRPLIEKLSFIKNKKQWGYAFRFGYLEIPEEDFQLIASCMLGETPVHIRVGN
jgi:hypothetical protein